MRRSLSRPRAVQLELFRPPPQTPARQTLPPEVKRRTTILLARMLHEHLTGRPEADSGKETTDE